MNRHEFRRHFFDTVEAGLLPACRYCGLLTSDGCHHVVTDFREDVLTAVIRRAADIQDTSVRIPIGANGLPLRHPHA